MIPLLLFIGTGLAVLLALLPAMTSSSVNGSTVIVISALSICMVVAGIVLAGIHVSQRSYSRSMEAMLAVRDDFGLGFTQLTKNYQILRIQTLIGFLIAGFTLLMGAIVILAGAFGQLFGLTAQGSNLTIVAGVISDFIAGVAIAFFKLSFDRLSDTSDRMLQTLIALSAVQQAEGLSDEDRPRLIVDIIRAMVGLPAQLYPSTSSRVP
jgi:hypothetical protein